MKEKVKIPQEIITLDLENMDLDNSDVVRRTILLQQDVIEYLFKAYQESREEIKRLKDEINRLKGEKGTPKFKPKIPTKENDFNPAKPEKWKKRSKKQHIKVDRVEYLKVDKSILPSDAEHKGYRSVIKQNIRFETDNVEYKLERYYSRSEGKLYEAKPPEGSSEFGNDLKAFILYLHHAGRIPEKKIQKILAEAGILISAGEISNILTKERSEEFTKEKQEIFEAGMNSSDYFHTDDTGGRHKSVNYHTHVICNTLYTVFFIMPKKDRDTIKAILRLKDDEKIHKIMISDDAKQFLLVALYHALCWIHEIRHYKKLNPLLESHRLKLRDFLTEIWKFYEQLEEYKKNSSEEQKNFLEQRFDELFSTKTDYGELDKRIELTRKKRDRLLLVLTYPQIPLHNNPAEIALREMVIKNRISYGTRSEDGKTAWENMMTLLDTCRKLNISFFDYLKNRFSEKNEIPSLATLILQRAQNSTVH
jgi:hypothetical protein